MNDYEIKYNNIGHDFVYVHPALSIDRSVYTHKQYLVANNEAKGRSIQN